MLRSNAKQLNTKKPSRKSSDLIALEGMSCWVDTLDMSFEFPLSDNRKVTYRTLFRGGMLIVEMAIEGFPRVESFVVAEEALDPPLLIHKHIVTPHSNVRLLWGGQLIDTVWFARLLKLHWDEGRTIVRSTIQGGVVQVMFLSGVIHIFLKCTAVVLSSWCQWHPYDTRGKEKNVFKSSVVPGWQSAKGRRKLCLVLGS
ncbi:hypothetical protein BGW80DRAFT_1406407 [Lactifluus volemus]|nr:hypothetical protein BGW80DRAFT_1406407 [Lactifluus volemus]